MGMKEKLVELVHNARMNALWHNAPNPSEYITDMLMEDGVTVQEWISVKDRFPEAGTKALCYLKRGEYWTAVWDDCGDDLWSDGEAWCSNGEVTHWMPLPKPPKGE